MQALQAFQTTRTFYHGIGELSSDEESKLLKHVAESVVVDEYEQQAVTNGDNNLRPLIRRMRSSVEKAQHMLLDNSKWPGSRVRDPVIDWLSRFMRHLAMGIFGGLTLLVPMIIMVQHPTKLMALVITSVFVFFMAVALSLALSTTNSEAQPKDVFAAIAAYTAVLVVFVGTSMTNTKENNRVISAIVGSIFGGIILLMLLLGLSFGPSYLVLRRIGKNRAALEFP